MGLSFGMHIDWNGEFFVSSNLSRGSSEINGDSLWLEGVNPDEHVCL